MALGCRLTCKELSAAWDIGPTQVTVPRNEAFRKVALTIVLYPDKAVADLAMYIDLAREELAIRNQTSTAGPPAKRPGSGVQAP